MVKQMFKNMSVVSYQHKKYGEINRLAFRSKEADMCQVRKFHKEPPLFFLNSKIKLTLFSTIYIYANVGNVPRS